MVIYYGNNVIFSCTAVVPRVNGKFFDAMGCNNYHFNKAQPT